MKRLFKYERNKIRDLNKIILNDDGVPNIMKIISEVKFRINNVLRTKNSKELITKEMVKRAGIEDENKIIEEGSSTSSNDETCVVEFKADS